MVILKDLSQLQETIVDRFYETGLFKAPETWGALVWTLDESLQTWSAAQNAVCLEQS